MRPWLIVLAGCGRLGFGPADVPSDASPDLLVDAEVDAVADAAIDGPALEVGMMLRFTLDDLGGGLVDTVSGRDVTCATACPTVAAGGMVDGALRFSGNSQGLRLAWDPTLETPDAFTISVWFLTSDNSGAIFSRTSSQDIWNTWQLEYLDGSPQFTTTSPVGNHDKMPGNPVAADTWVHLAGVWDGSSKRLYMDGVEVASKPWPALLLDTEPIVIGYDINAGVNQLYVRGSIDDVRLYDRALLPAEIAGLAQ